ncbi:MAG: hypothetical protein ABW157_12415 [Candidatus Thiodiazotropha sp. LLP2]
MYRLPKKLLAVLLSVLLGLIPMQGAVAGVDYQQDGDVHQHLMDSNHSNIMVLMEDHAAMMDCDKCNTTILCGGNSCSSGHCISCILALLPEILIPTLQISVSIVTQSNTGLMHQPPSSHFRPPRA